MASKAKGKMILPTMSAAALWEAEISGQISDGMWENAVPHDHYQSWLKLELSVVPGSEPRVETDTMRFSRTNYNLSRLLNIGSRHEPDYCIRDRMILKGRMGAALESLAMKYNANVIAAAEYMPAIYEEWAAMNASDAWKHDFAGRYMKTVTDEIARAFYARSESYGLKQMKEDLSLVKAAIKSAKG